VFGRVGRQLMQGHCKSRSHSRRQSKLGPRDVKARGVLAQIGLKNFVDDLAKFRSLPVLAREDVQSERGTPASVRALELAIGSRRASVNRIIWIIGAIVVVLAILSFLGLR
jgi:hypothetical protein